ncbi:MAG: 50S ribosomal protein L22 [Flavobacteriaceae bacterium]|nr:50S ribosomal protein L22 [Flavobacteriaceae bacterium]MCY4216330.1 50S ribosomal protein L22 [Flavobacteriaceae bacterium]MCY4253302.1 50S ribosomal protein L22 [Flavobacteriaceae bacterium]
MGSRKRAVAIKRKEQKKDIVVVKLNKCPVSPRKMRLVADQIRGLDVKQALNVLKFSSKAASIRVEKLLLSALNSWQLKNQDNDIEEFDFRIKEIRVDSGAMLKRIRFASRGRVHRIRKRTNHTTLVLNVQPIQST